MRLQWQNDNCMPCHLRRTWCLPSPSGHQAQHNLVFSIHSCWLVRLWTLPTAEAAAAKGSGKVEFTRQDSEFIDWLANAVGKLGERSRVLHQCRVWQGGYSCLHNKKIRYTNNIIMFSTFCSVTPEKNFSSQTLRVFLGEVAAIGWKPCGATLLGFDVDKGCHGETGRPKTMPKNRGLFTGVMKCQALLERENDSSGGSKTMKKESFFSLRFGNLDLTSLTRVFWTLVTFHDTETGFVK